MPKPPKLGGLATLGQAIKQCPPLASFVLFHRKPLLILSVASNDLAWRSRASNRQISMELSTSWTKIFLPAFVSKSVLQPDSNFPNNGLNLSFGQFGGWRGGSVWVSQETQKLQNRAEDLHLPSTLVSFDLGQHLEFGVRFWGVQVEERQRHHQNIFLGVGYY